MKNCTTCIFEPIWQWPEPGDIKSGCCRYYRTGEIPAGFEITKLLIINDGIDCFARGPINNVNRKNIYGSGRIVHCPTWEHKNRSARA